MPTDIRTEKGFWELVFVILIANTVGLVYMSPLVELLNYRIGVCKGNNMRP